MPTCTADVYMGFSRRRGWALQAMEGEFRSICEQEKGEVVGLGGLHVIGTERHESRRIDNQLRGRCGRCGRCTGVCGFWPGFWPFAFSEPRRLFELLKLLAGRCRTGAPFSCMADMAGLLVVQAHCPSADPASWPFCSGCSWHPAERAPVCFYPSARNRLAKVCTCMAGKGTLAARATS